MRVYILLYFFMYFYRYRRVVRWRRRRRYPWRRRYYRLGSRYRWHDGFWAGAAARGGGLSAGLARGLIFFSLAASLGLAAMTAALVIGLNSTFLSVTVFDNLMHCNC